MGIDRLRVQIQAAVKLGAKKQACKDRRQKEPEFGFMQHLGAFRAAFIVHPGSPEITPSPETGRLCGKAAVGGSLRPCVIYRIVNIYDESHYGPW